MPHLKLVGAEPKRPHPAGRDLLREMGKLDTAVRRDLIIEWERAVDQGDLDAAVAVVRRGFSIFALLYDELRRSDIVYRIGDGA